MNADKAESFKDILSDLMSGSVNKRTNEKTLLLDRALLLLEMKEVQAALLGDGWRSTLLTIGALTRMECEDNRKKLSLTTKSFKKGCFALWKYAVRLHLKDCPAEVGLKDLIGTLMKCFSDNCNIWQLVDSDVWLDTIALLSDTFKAYSLTDVPFDKLKLMWRLCLSRLKNTLPDGKSRLERQKLSELFNVLVKAMPCTEFYLEGRNVISECKAIILEYNWPAKDPSKTNFLETLNDLFSNYGFEHRDLLLDNFFGIAEKLYVHMELFAPLESTLAVDGNERISNFQSSFCEFLEWLLTLCVPDCEINSLNFEPVFTLVQNVLHRLVQQIAEQIEKQNSTYRLISKCAIPADKLALLGKLFVINHLWRLRQIQQKDSSQNASIDKPRPKKRARKSSSQLVEVLLRSTSPAHLQILLELLRSWKHRLDDATVHSIGEMLLRNYKTFLKEEDRRAHFLKILAELIDLKPRTIAPEEVFNWILPLLHHNLSHEDVCMLMVQVLSSADKSTSLRSKHTFDVVINNISRLPVFKSGTIQLIHFLVCNYDYDEGSVFRAELSMDDNAADQATTEWIFRNQLIRSILKYTESSIYLADVLFALLSYLPNDAGTVRSGEELTKTEPTLEELLAEVYCAKKFPAKVKNGCAREGKSVPMIDSLLDACACAIIDVFNLECTEDEKKLQLWRTTSCLLGKLNQHCNDFQGGTLLDVQALLDQFVLSSSWLSQGKSKANDEIYEALNLGNFWPSASPQIKQFVQSAAESGASLLHRYIVHWSPAIPVEFLKDALGNFNCLPNSNIESLIISVLDDLTFSICSEFCKDLELRLPEKLCGMCFSSKAEADDCMANTSGSSLHSQPSQLNESLFAKFRGESSKNAQLLRQSLTANEILRCLKELPKLMSFTSEDEWNKLGVFLLQNGAIRMLAIRFSPSSFGCQAQQIEKMFEAVLSECVPKSIEEFVFLRMCLEKLDAHEVHGEALRRLLISFSHLHCVEFVKDFEEIVPFYAESLAYLFELTQDKPMDAPVFESLLRNKSGQASVHFLLNDAEPLDVCHSPGLFFLSSKLLCSVLQRSSFARQWASLFHNGNCARIFSSLRNHLYYSFKSDVQKALASPIVINSIILLFENFNWAYITSDSTAFSVLQDILSLGKILFINLVEFRKSSDMDLRWLFGRWFKFISKLAGVSLFEARIYPLALQVLDSFLDADFQCRFPVTWRFLSTYMPSEELTESVVCDDRNSTALHFVRQYCKNCLNLGDSGEISTALFSADSATFMDSMNINHVDKNSDVVLLRGFWRCMLDRVSDGNLSESSLRLFFRTYFFHPRLRCEVAPLLSLYPSDRVKVVRNEMLKKFCTDGTLKEFIRGASQQLLFGSCQVFPPVVCAALYNSAMMCNTDDEGNSLMGSVMCEEEEHPVAVNCQEQGIDIYALILFLRRCESIKQFPRELSVFLPVAEHSPMYAAFLIPRIIKELASNKSTEAQKQAIIAELNANIGKLHSRGEVLSQLECQFLMSIASVMEVWRGCEHYLDLLPFVRCLIKANFFEDARYFLRYYVDFNTSPPNATDPRIMFHIRGGEAKHLIESVKNVDVRESLFQLLVKVFIETGDSALLSSLPLNALITQEARIFSAESQHDWGAVSGLYSGIGDNDKMTEAFYYLGSESLQQCSTDAQYNSILALASWDQINNSTALISFPKIAKSQSRGLYQIVKLEHDGKPPMIEKCFYDLIQEIMPYNQCVMDWNSLEQVRNLTILRRHAKLAKRDHLDRRMVDSEKPCLVLLTSWEMAQNYSKRGGNIASLVDVVIRRSKQLRKLHSYQPALKLLDKTDRIAVANGNTSLLPYSFLERAKLLMACKESSMAQHFLKRILMEFDSAAMGSAMIDFSSANEMTPIRIKAHVLLSEIASNDEQAMEHLRQASEYSDLIAKQYPSLCEQTFVRFAIFAEKRYRELRAFMESPTFALKKEAVRHWEKEISDSYRSRKRSNNSENDLSRKQREIDCENAEIKTVSDSKITYLMEASRLYLSALAFGSSTNGVNKTVIHRFAAVLLQNIESVELMRLATGRIDQIPSQRFLPIYNILTSHLFSTGFPIAGLVEKITISIVKDHPYHSLNYLLFYMGSSSDDSEVCDTRKKITMGLVKKLMSVDESLREVVMTLKKSHDIYRDFSCADIQGFEKSATRGKHGFRIPSRLRIIAHFKDLMKTPIPVLTHRLNMAGDYNPSEMVTFSAIDEVCDKADGLSTPKVVTVTGSTGVKYKLIFKKDDLRQDGLVQQLFQASNFLMEQFRPPASISKHFSPLRTYNVLPLDHKYGIIEWCLGTQSLCSYLAGQDKKGGAHLRYRPKEPTVLQCRAVIESLTKADQNPKSRSDCCRLFLECCQKISPVFRYFFYEKFHQPAVFHERILAYTQSLAQWSIVCYVVGLGDRHLSNILIEDDSGELVHIDLGMIFEYGHRMLRVPEKVPFRLTRDMVDPILMDGIDGRFKKIAVHTLKLMRENAQVLIGISSLILHDPISTFKSLGADKSQRNLYGEMAISRLKEKLAGRDLTFAEMNADEQVTRLIADARDPEKLSQMYFGWLAFL